MGYKTILSVEDDDAAFHILKLAFCEAAPDIILRRARDGDQAISLLCGAPGQERIQPDLILLNLNLPKRSGFEVLEEVKRQELTNLIPVVVFSSSSLDKDKARCLALGAERYLTKPNSFAEVIHAIRSVCGLLA